MGVDQPGFRITDGNITAGQVDQLAFGGFNFSSGQHNPGLKFFQDLIMMLGFFIGSESGHALIIS